MKKALVSVLRLTMFVGALALFPSIRKGPEAQLAHQCVTFETEDFTCPSCCSSHSTVYQNNIVNETSGTGIQSILNTEFSCGSTPASCNGVACGSGEYPQAVSDSGCCIASGSTCASNEPCCPGTICRSNGTCGTCSLTGESCGTTADCCVSGDTCYSGVCTAQSDSCPCYDQNGNCSFSCDSPIILDLNGEGFHLTDVANGVVFDISGTGHPIRMGWIARGAENGFLTLPGADGLVHNGTQLFGNFTPQPPSTTPNGFAALAVYDDPKNGGNGDGIIDARDAVFASLRLWIDENHDGICQPDELHALPSLGVNSISLTYKLGEKTDQYGNRFRYRARVNPDKGTDVGKTAYDVFFVTLGH
jgi:hypothetical protein